VRRSPLARANAALAGMLVVAQAVYVLSGLRLVGAPRSVYLSLLRAPLLVAWKLALLARTVVVPGRVEWTRTSRNEGPIEGRREPVGPLAVVLGVPVEDVTLEDAVERCSELVEVGRATGRTHQVATVNVDFLLGAKRDPAVLEILQRADLAIPDGMPIVWASRLLDPPLRERVAGADLVPALAARAAERGYSVYLFGSAPGVAEEAALRLRSDNPGLRIVGAAGPVFDDVADVDPAVLDEIAAAEPDIVCVALGHPKQEQWIAAHRERVGAPVLVGVGGSLDFLVGHKRRAPRWMQRSGLEWLHRVATEPSRLASRYGHALVHFPRLLLWEVGTTSPGPPPASSSGWLERRGGPAVLRLESGLDLFNHALPPEVEAILDARRRLVVDLSPMARLDRVTLASLIVLGRRARAAGDALVLVGVSEPARRTLRALRMDGLFASPDEAAAVTSATARAPMVVEVSRRRTPGDDEWGFRFSADRRVHREPSER
jgi:N-acetylglucosaminyldiphosphoundecaprenol N-acetyl-beta-D-mannosaminyltransferase